MDKTIQIALFDGSKIFLRCPSIKSSSKIKCVTLLRRPINFGQIGIRIVYSDNKTIQLGCVSPWNVIFDINNHDQVAEFIFDSKDSNDIDITNLIVVV